MSAPLTRRRFIGIAAAVAGTAALPLVVRSAARAGAAPEATVWRGVALGADAELRLYHPDKSFAQALIQRTLVEVSRLEKIFSLYRDDSLLVQLNRNGSLSNPPADLLALLSQSRRLHTLTQGTFDPSIQPLWNAYAEHYTKQPESSGTPADLPQALDKVGFGQVDFDSNGIRFAQPGMALSFNGIAQGYITDRITDMLQTAGMPQALVDMGEIRALDNSRSRIWQAGVRNPSNEDGTLFNIPVGHGQALATSGGYGTYMDRQGRHTHLFDPHTGQNQPRYRSVSVSAASAATADALSTAFSVMSREQIQAVLQQSSGVKAWLVGEQGQVDTLG